MKTQNILIATALILSAVFCFLLFKYFRWSSDIFNDIATPVVTAISLFFIYKTLRAQQDTLKSQQDALDTQTVAITLDNSKWQFETYLKLFDDMKKSYEGMTRTVKRDFNDGTKEGTFTGEMFISHIALDFLAANKLADDHPEVWQLEPYLTQITFFIDDFHFLAMYIQRSSINEKAFFRARLVNFYTEYLETALQTLSKVLVKRECADKFYKSFDQLQATMRAFKLMEKEREEEIKQAQKNARKAF